MVLAIGWSRKGGGELGGTLSVCVPGGWVRERRLGKGLGTEGWVKSGLRGGGWGSGWGR